VIGENKAHRGKFPAHFFGRNKPVAQSKTFLNAREVMEFVALKPGEYLIVPSTFHPNETASFILTIISKVETHVHESSGVYPQESMETKKLKPGKDNKDEEKKISLFRQFSDKYEEVDAEKLQLILNDRILKGDLKSGGFSTDACRSMVALMDVSF
ncbi:calpain-1 catalytic subunit-like, partial [Oryzias melastigma]|uniref:calpain-1 catalytic subunit-like n=1 Tax=Oryzias melastigma TaxID=30732 RepID=UPI00168D1C79